MGARNTTMAGDTVQQVKDPSRKAELPTGQVNFQIGI